MENIEARIRRLEAFVLGQNIDYQPADEQIVESLLNSSRKIASVVSKSDKVSSLLKRADEVVKYGDPQYLESDSMTLEPVLQQLLISKEEEVKEGLEHYQKLKELKTVLDSQAILGVPDLQEKLQKLIVTQENQEESLAKLSNQTYDILQNYHNFVNQISLNFEEISNKISKQQPTATKK